MPERHGGGRGRRRGGRLWRVVRARLRRVRNVLFRASSPASLRCPRPFDVVYAIESLVFTEPLTLFDVLETCLRPGGRFVLIDAFTADGVAEASGEARTAVRVVESGFGTRLMPSLSHWRSSARVRGFSVQRWWNWTSLALPFWDTSAWAARRAVSVYGWLPTSTRGHVAGTLMAPHALRGGAAVYGGLVLHRELQAGRARCVA